MKAGAVVNLAEAEAGGAPRRRSGRARRPRCSSNRWCCRCRPAVPAANSIAANVNVAGSGVTDGDIARALAAGSRPFGARRAASCCIRCRSAMRSTACAASAIRAACSAREFGVDMHVVTADVAAARNLMLAVERCHLDVEAMVAGALCGGPVGARRRRGRSRRRADRHGRRHHDHGGVLRRPLRPCRRLRARRQSRHHGLGARAERSYL